MQGNYVRPETALARLYAQWGGGYLEQQEYRNALAAFQIGQAIDPGEFSVNMGLARCASQRRDYRQALHWLRLALAVRPGDALALGALGDTYAALGDWPAARAAYAAGVQNRPNVQTGFLALRLAQAQWKLGDRAGAVATLEAAERTPMRQTAAQLLDAIRARKEPSFTTVVGGS
jgi:tetratricopeptide (TPR) repeat protein